MQKTNIFVIIFPAILFLSGYVVFSCAAEKPDRIGSPVSNAHQKSKKGEYIITVVKDSDDASIKQIFLKYEIIEIKRIQENTFLIKIKSDPGIEKLKMEIKDSKTIVRIQPNYVYRAVAK